MCFFEYVNRIPAWLRYFLIVLLGSIMGLVFFFSLLLFCRPTKTEVNLKQERKNNTGTLVFFFLLILVSSVLAFQNLIPIYQAIFGFAVSGILFAEMTDNPALYSNVKKGLPPMLIRFPQILLTVIVLAANNFATIQLLKYIVPLFS